MISPRTALVLGLATSSAMAQSLYTKNAEVIIAPGDTLPGIAGRWVSNFGSDYFVDQNGTMSMAVDLNATSAIDQRLIAVGKDSSTLTVIARGNDPAPGIAGAFLRNSVGSINGFNYRHAMSPHNEFLAWGSSIYDPATPANTPSSSDSALFWGALGIPFQKLLREGEQDLAVFPGGETWGTVNTNINGLQINSAGKCLFTQLLAIGSGAPAVTSNDFETLIFGSPGALQLVARTGTTASWMGAGETWIGEFGDLAINDNNQVLFSAKLNTGSNADDSVAAYWTSGAGEPSLILREGDAAPGFGNPSITLLHNPWSKFASFGPAGNFGLIWRVSDGPGVIIDEGSTSTNGGNDQVLYRGNANAPGFGITKILQEGDLTGLPDGSRHGYINTPTLATADDGSMAFTSGFQDNAGVPLAANAPADDGMWYIDPAGNKTLILRKGDNPSFLGSTANGPWVAKDVSAPPAINKHRQVVFSQQFTDSVNTIGLLLAWHPTLGFEIVFDSRVDTITTNWAAGKFINHPNNVTSPSTANGSAGSPAGLSHSGDIGLKYFFAAPAGNCILKIHSGMLRGWPSTIDTIAGGTQNWEIRAGASRAGELYGIVGSTAGPASPGLPILGGFIPLNPSPYLSLSISLLSQYPSAPMMHSLGFLDANGEAPSLSAPLFPSAACGLVIPPLTTLAPGQYHHVAVFVNFATLTITGSSEVEPLFIY